jgi:hypothetical protein
VTARISSPIRSRSESGIANVNCDPDGILEVGAEEEFSNGRVSGSGRWSVRDDERRSPCISSR